MASISEIDSWKVEILPEEDGKYGYECYQGVEDDRVVIKSESLFTQKKEAETAAENAIAKINPDFQRRG